eukprot:3178560-Pleurochrysis_carterae.AAC.2
MNERQAPMRSEMPAAPHARRCQCRAIAAMANPGGAFGADAIRFGQIEKGDCCGKDDSQQSPPFASVFAKRICARGTQVSSLES